MCLFYQYYKLVPKKNEIDDQYIYALGENILIILIHFSMKIVFFNYFYLCFLVLTMRNLIALDF